MSTSGRRDPAQQSTTAGSPAGSAPAGAAPSPGSAPSARRIVLLVAIVLVAIPFLIALWMLCTAAASAPDTDGRGARLLLGAFTLLATGVVLLALIPWVFSKDRSEEHTSELQSRFDLVCRLLLEKKTKKNRQYNDN